MRESLTGHLLVASSLVEDPIYAGGVCLIVHEDETNVFGVMLNRPMKPSADAILAMLGDSTEGATDEAEQTGPENRLAGHDGPAGAAESIEERESIEKTESIEKPDSIEDDRDSAGTDLAATAANVSESSPWRMLHFGGPLSGPVVAIHQVSQLAEAETGDGIYVAAQKQHLENLMRGQASASPYRLIVGHLGWEWKQLETEIDSGIWHVVPATVDTVFSSASEMWPGLIRRATSKSLARWIGVRDVIGASELN